jgi:hypothetical protein
MEHGRLFSIARQIVDSEWSDGTVLCLGFLFIFYAYIYQMGPFSRCKSFVVAYLVIVFNIYDIKINYFTNDLGRRTIVLYACVLYSY